MFMIRDEIKAALTKAVKKSFGGIKIPEFSVAIPESPEHGDYATNVAMVLAKVLKKPPMEIATAIAQELRSRNYELWEVKIASPGFINLFLLEEKLRNELEEILKQKEKYGRGKNKKEKIQIEFISANPTGPLTLANGRGGFLGDALANVLEAGGFWVEREYYVNDAGNQVLLLGKSLLAAGGFMSEEENFYQGDYIKEWAKRHAAVVKRYRSDPMRLGQLAAKDFLSSIKKIIRKAGIRFDRFTSEAEQIHKKDWPGRVNRIFEDKGLLYKKDGAAWLKTTEFGDDKDRVLVTSDGFPTYFFADAGHYLETKKRGFDTKINIVGPDHYGYVARIQAVARMIGLKRSEVIVTQAVRLWRGGAEVKMSKRKGAFTTLQELLQEIPLDAARYFFLEKSPDTHMDFDLDLAKERSVKNPVYYIQYAHARTASIFGKIRNQKSEIKSINQNAKLNLLNKPEELGLLKKLIQFPEKIEDAAQDYQIHRLTRYAYELARAFHNFYEKHRVIVEDKELTQARLALVKATQVVLRSTLDLLGISAPRRM